MADKKYPQSQLPIRQSVELLPKAFQTTANEKFMEAVVDPLIQPGILEKTVGYIGRRYGKTYRSNSIYLDTDNTLRSRYQLEPGVVLRDDDKIQEFYDYLDFKNQLKFFGNTDERDNLICDQENYSWDPPIDWDKFVNYREYYWEPLGPPAVPIFGQRAKVTSTYSVMQGTESSYVFTPDGFTNNPTLTLYRGQTYKFKVNSPREGFFIRTGYDTGSLRFDPQTFYTVGQQMVYDDKLWRALRDVLPSDGANIYEGSPDWQLVDSALLSSSLDYNKGVTNNGVQNGTLTFEVPYDAPDLLFYQSSVNPDRYGQILIANVEENTTIDVEKEIVGKAGYTSSNGITLSSGMVIEFRGRVAPEKYTKDTWLVEGVGSEIRLIRFLDLEVPVISTRYPDVVFDNAGFDTEPFDDARAFPNEKDYVTINRSSSDSNPWSRYNRWFHRSVLEYAYSSRGQDFPADETLRAKRPIIEFLPDLQLFQHGSKAKAAVDFVEDFTTDVFSLIEGSTGYIVDGEQLFQGARLLVISDTDNLVNNKIYSVNFITHNGVRQISLLPAEDAESQPGDCLLVRRGAHAGLMFDFDGETWRESQIKSSVNQAPLFEAYDEDGTSFANVLTYPINNFKGSKILSYKQGNGTVDKETGFKLSYLNIDNVGDIEFQWDWGIDSFVYTKDQLLVEKTLTNGFYRFNGKERYANGWIRTDNKYLQPIIDSTIVQEDTDSVTLTSIDWSSDPDFLVNFYIDGVKIDSQFQRNGNLFKFDRTFSKGQVLTAKIITVAEPNTGYYEIPAGLEKNPLNFELLSFTLGQAIDHVASALEFSEEFSGPVPGQSNLRDLSDYRQHSKRFMKHAAIAPVAISMLCDKTSNIIKALQYSKKAYTNFKNSLLDRATDLDLNENIPDYLDEVIAELSKAKTTESAFSDSLMLGSGAYTAIVYDVEDTGTTTFALSERFSLDTVNRRAVYVYINGQQLIHDRDYEFNENFGFVDVKASLTEGDRVEIREYVSTTAAFVPSTPTSFGLYKKYLPKIFLDDTYREPRMVIQGHDGSITAAFGDYRDDLLLEFELRIYNNIRQKYDEKIFDLDALIGGYYGNSQYTKARLDDIVVQDFLRWIENTGINYTENAYFRENDVDYTETFTYTYSEMTDPENKENLPGWWRGVYQYFYDTDRPHRCPWEMLGFSEQPDWWESVYGPAPYTCNNLLLWEDLQAGIIRQGPRSGINPRYARPTLLSHIPVDGDGILLSPLDSNLAQNFVLINNRGDFKFGDIAPVEYAWRSSSEWPFAMMVAACLMKPFEFIPDNFDRTKVRVNRLGQTVNSVTGKFVALDDIVVPTLEDSPGSGLVNYLIDHAKSRRISLEIVENKLKDLDVNLATRLSGFVDKSQQKYLLDSKNPRSSSSSVFVPPENYDIIFEVSSPIRSVSYSGVIVEKIEDGWTVSGYDTLYPYFNYYLAVANQADPLITVGGVSEQFVEWEPDRTFNNGQIVQYKNDFYRSLKTHRSGEEFDPTLWKKLPKIPTVGGVEAFRRRSFDTSKVRRISYGSKLPTIQDVVDFLLGYEVYLKSLGFVFDNYDVENKVSQDWISSAKEFMFWTRHNWAMGSLITLSPAASKLNLSVPVGVSDNLLDGFYDYQIFKSDGAVLNPRFLNVNRSFQQVILETTNTTEGIYFARINFVVKEHVTVFTDRTVFNDIIYDKTTGYRQERIKSQGFRTVDWDGDYTSPGFLFDNVNIDAWQPFRDYRLGDIVEYQSRIWTSQKNQLGSEEFDDSAWSIADITPEKQLIANFDYKINQFDDFYDTSFEGAGSDQRALARHSVGYQDRRYLQDLAEDPVTQFQLYQGFIREKGTNNSITKVFEKLSRTSSGSVTLDEEWAFRVGRLGGVDQIREIEFTLQKDKFSLNPQPLLIVDNAPKYPDDLYYRILEKDFTVKEMPFSTAVTKTSLDAEPVRVAGYVKNTHVAFSVGTVDSILDLDIADFSENDHIWVAFVNSQWTVLRFNESENLRIVSAEKTGSTVVIELSQRHGIRVNDIIGIRDIANLSGFFKVIEIDPTSVVVGVDSSAEDPEVDSSTLYKLYLFTDCRFDSYLNIDPVSSALLPEGSRLWVDNNGSGLWEVVEKKKQYENSQIDIYGQYNPLNAGYKVVYDDVHKQTLVSLPGSGYVMAYSESGNTLVPRARIETPSTFRTEVNYSFGQEMAVSPDGRWLVISAPLANNVFSRYRGLFDPVFPEFDAAFDQTTMTVTNISSGSTIRIGARLVGPGIVEGTVIVAQTLGLPGKNGTYTVRPAQSNITGTISVVAGYQQDDIVLEGGKLWQAVNDVFGDGSTINIATEDWTPAKTVRAFSNDIGGLNSGHSQQGMLFFYERIGQRWVLKDSIISPRPQADERFGSRISIAQSGNSYYMAVSAPGSMMNKGRVYLYEYDSEWKHYEDPRYEGPYDSDPAVFYPKGTVVYSDEQLWQAQEDVFGDGSTIGIDSLYWAPIDPIATQNSLPQFLAVGEDESTTVIGPLDPLQLVELVKEGDQFGSGLAMNRDGTVIAIGAPRADQSYRGVWSSEEFYNRGDIVEFNQVYYKLVSDPVLEPSQPNSGWELSQGSNRLIGKVFVYQRSSNGAYDLKQTISLDTLPTINDIPFESRTVASETNSADDSILVDSTFGIRPTMIVRFSGETFGGITADVNYYVKEVLNPRSAPGYITISRTPDGPVLPLSDSSGTVDVLFGGLPDLENRDRFGHALDMDYSGSTLVVTCPNGDVNADDQGTAYIFRTEGFADIEYRLKQTIDSFSNNPNEYFGQSVSITANSEKIVIGAMNSQYSVAVVFDRGSNLTFDRNKTKFVKNLGASGAVYVFDRKAEKYFLTEKLEADLGPYESFGFSIDCTDSRIAVGSPTYTGPYVQGQDLSTKPQIGTMRLFRTDEDAESWEVIAVRKPVVDISTVKSMVLYDTIRDVKLQDVDFVDPAKFKILNIAEQELKFKTLYDPAIYSFGTEDQIVDPPLAWTTQHVGELWWDLSTAKWSYYEQGDLAYRIGNWNDLAAGAVIDVYEWVETPLLPNEWSALADTNEGLAEGISGQPLYPNNDVYSAKVLFNEYNGEPTGTLYYYWVKNKVTVPSNVTGRRIAAKEVSGLISNPAGSGVAFISLISESEFLAYNFGSVITSDFAQLNIEYYVDKNSLNPIHAEYQLLTEGVADSLPTASLETKWLDSLIGHDQAGNVVPDNKLSDKQRYGISFRPRQTMFVDRLKALEITVKKVNDVLLKEPFADTADLTLFSLVDEIPDPALNLYDTVVDSDVDLITVITARIKPAIITGTLLDGKLDTIQIVDPGFGYKVPPSIVIDGDGRDAKISITLDLQGRVSSAKIVSRGKRYSTISIEVRKFAVLVRNDSTLNGFWTINSWDEERKQFFKSQTQTYDTRKYWTAIDWWKQGYGPTSRIVKEIIDISLVPTLTLKLADLIRVKNFTTGGWAVFEKIADTGADFSTDFRIVGRQNGTVQISAALYDLSLLGIGYDNTRSFDIGAYDLENYREMRYIFKGIKENIFTGQYAVEWNNLFFAAIRYVFYEQTYVDWAFKTSFLNAMHNIGHLEQKLNYRSDNLTSFQQYIDEVKPYRTTVREYVSKYDAVDNTNTAMVDFDLPAVYSTVDGKIISISEKDDRINQYPWKWWLDNKGFSVIEIRVYDQGEDYVSPPTVVVEGNGTPVSAQAYISSGRVTKVKIYDGGKNYTKVPSVYLVGGNGNSRNIAKAVAILGDSKFRSLKLGIKFDRISKRGIFESLVQEESFVGTGYDAAFDLRYPPSRDRTRVEVSVNAQILLADEYKINLYNLTVNNRQALKGRLILTTAPAEGDQITITYIKNEELLDSVNRIGEFYAPVSGMKGNDLSQLMTGIDFGGVQIQGSTFDTTGGWDASPWYTDSWDNVETSKDYYYVYDAQLYDPTKKYRLNNTVKYQKKIYRCLSEDLIQGIAPQDDPSVWIIDELISVTLPYVPEKYQEINIYRQISRSESFDYDSTAVYVVDAIIKFNGNFYKCAVQETIPGDSPNTAPAKWRRIQGVYRIDDPAWGTRDSSTLTNPEALLPTFVGDGVNNEIRISGVDDTFVVTPGEVLIFRPVESDGSVNVTDANLLDTVLSGGTLEAMSGAFVTATGISAEDLIVEGGTFVSPEQVPAPEENVPGQVLDSLTVKVFQRTDNTEDSTVSVSAYELHKDMLNKHYFKRYSVGEIVLVKDLNYYDLTIEINDGSLVFDPILRKNVPGMIEINGERIEYLNKQGNILSQLRRGVQGTSIGELYPAGTKVADVSGSESLPYQETQERVDFLTKNPSDGGIVTLPYDGSTQIFDLDSLRLFGNGDNNNLIVRLNGAEVQDYELVAYGDGTPGGQLILADSIVLKDGDTVTIESLLYGPLNYTPAKTDRAGWYRETIPSYYGAADEIEVFLAGRRLRKDSTEIYDETLGSPDTAAGKKIEAEFSVDGVIPYIRITDPTDIVGLRITVIKRTGKLWYETLLEGQESQPLLQNNTPIARFIAQKTTDVPE